MSSARITYFSGTGNTRRACRLMENALEQAGWTVETVEVGAREGKHDPGKGFDISIFAFPVYAWSMPQIMRSYIRRLPAPSNGGKAAVLAVFGDTFSGRAGSRVHSSGYEGGSLREARRLLTSRGFHVFAAHALGYPESFTQVVAPLSRTEQESIRAASDARLAGVVNALVMGQGNDTRYSTRGLVWNEPTRVGFQGFARRLLGKVYVADGSCTGCGLCARICPASAIRMAGKKPRWRWNCQACQRCMNACPEASIQTSALRLILLVLVPSALPYNRILTRIAGMDARSMAGTGGILAVAVWLAGATIAMIAVSWILSVWERVPGLRRALWAGHTSRFGRYKPPEL